MPVVFVFGIVGVIAPLLPLYFAGIGMNKSQIAVLLAVPGIVTIAANQWWGYLADLRVNRKRLLIAMSVFAAGVAFVYPMARSFAAVVGMAAALSFFSDARIPMLQATVLADRDGENRFALQRTIGSLSFICFLFGTDWMMQHSTTGDAVMFRVAVVMNILLVLSLFPLKDRVAGRPTRSDGLQHMGFWQVQRVLLRKPVIRWFFIFLLVFQFPHMLSLGFQAVLLQETGVKNPGFWTGMCFGIGALIETVAFLKIKQVLTRVRLMPMFLIAAAAQVIRWGLIAAHPTLAVIVLSNLLHLFTFGVTYICSIVLINREAPPEFRSSGQSLLAIVYSSVANMLGPLFGALFFTAFGIRDWYAFAAVIALLAIPLGWRVKTLYEREHGVSGFWVRGAPASATVL